MFTESIPAFILWLSITLVSIYTINFRNRCKKDLSDDKYTQLAAYLNAILTMMSLYTFHVLISHFNPYWGEKFLKIIAVILSVVVSSLSINFIKKCKNSSLTTNALWIPVGGLIGVGIVSTLSVIK